MKKVIAVVMGLLLLCGSYAMAEVLNDNELAGIYAGDDSFAEDDIIAENSAVASQKNIAVVGSTDSSVSGTSISNSNVADVLGEGDSSVAIQTNIAAISLGGGESGGNSITNSNDAAVSNLVVGPGAVDALSDAGTESGGGSHSAFTLVEALASAVASQTNIAAVAGDGTISGTSISNSNSAVVTNSGI